MVAAAVIWVPPVRLDGTAATVALTALAASWPVVMAARARAAEQVLGMSRPYAGAMRALAGLVATLAVVTTVLGRPVPAAGLLAVVAVLAVGGLGVRLAVGRRDQARRRGGLAAIRTVVVGPENGASAVIDRLAEDDDHALHIVGACLEDHEGRIVETVPSADWVVADGDGEDGERTPVASVVAAVLESGAQTVCIAPGSSFSGQPLRALGWALEEVGAELVADLGLIDVGAHRVQVGRAGASTVVHVRQARPAGASLVAKRAGDRVLAAIGLVLLSPLLAVVALAVRLSGPGPVLYRQVRVGRDGLMFTMVKFRTMCADADVRRTELLESADGDGPMFKMRLDPRITRVGRVLRRFSLDELPQLFNVLRGEMSLVGPRPPLPEEVATYGPTERRRLRAIPGMTGLWQVSGRSNLTWSETVRLDLTYVDNWTLGGDARLLGRTAGAVVRGTGAY